MHGQQAGNTHPIAMLSCFVCGLASEYRKRLHSKAFAILGKETSHSSPSIQSQPLTLHHGVDEIGDGYAQRQVLRIDLPVSNND